MSSAGWPTHPAVLLGVIALAIQPPLVPLIAGFADWAAPGSLSALRAVPALMPCLIADWPQFKNYN